MFATFFQCVSGIETGANISGELKDPSSSIPKGTLLAILTTYLSYVIHTLLSGASFVRDASGDLAQYQADVNSSTILDK